MSTAGLPVHAKIEKELANMVINPAKHSTKEYYDSMKDKSYPLNLESDKRGRAIIFTMTENRPGWDEDVKSLYRMLKSINFDVKRVYDPDYNEICADLKAFVEHSDNHHIDICFVIFMGHGCSTRTNLNDVNLQIRDGTFNIWAESVNIFRKKTSLLREKPKVFIVQSCRSVNNRITDLGGILPDTSFTDYKLVFASQPGTVADRENHHFINNLTNLVTKEAHWKHLGELIIKLCMKFREDQHLPWVNGQMPQTLQSLSRYLNIFPGITKDFMDASCLSLKAPQQESGGSIQGESELSSLTDAMDTTCFENLQKLQGKRPNTQPTGTPEENKPNSKDTSLNSGQNQKGQSCSSLPQSKDEVFNKQDAKEESNGPKTDIVEKEINATKFQAILQIEVKVEPSSDSQVQKTEEVLFNSVKQEKQRNDMEEKLTTECETTVTIDDVTKGSILLHITCDMKALEPLRFLSETGLLSSKFSSLLVTKSLIENCNINHVTLNVKLKITDQKVLRAMNPMVYCLPFFLTFLKKAFTVKSPIQTSGEAQWFHDGRPIKSDVRINIYKDDGNMCVLKVKEACESDSGVYCLKCTSVDGFPTEVKITVLVMNQSAPSNVKAEATETEIKVTWDAAIGNIKSYYVEYLHAPDMVVPESLVVSTTIATIRNLLPGKTYKVYVRSVSEDGVSDPEPPEGLTVHTPPVTPVGHFIKDPRSSVLSRYLNTFPGITKDLLDASCLSLKVPQQESGGSIQGESELSSLTDAMDTTCFENLQKLQGKRPNTKPTGTPEEKRSKDTSLNSGQNKKGQSCSSSPQSKDEEGNKQDAQEESNGQKTDIIEDKSNATKCPRILQIKVKPSSDSQDQKTEEALFYSVKQRKLEKQRKDIEELLSTECESPVTIDDVTKGVHH